MMNGEPSNPRRKPRIHSEDGWYFRGVAPVLDWARLERADDVEIFQGTERIASGKIDLTAPDGSMLWIQSKGADGRRLFLRADVMVFKHPSQQRPDAGAGSRDALLDQHKPARSNGRLPNGRRS